MAKFSRLQVWNTMERVGLIPLFYHGDVQVALQVVAAVAAGGAKVIEFTNRGDRAFQVFGELIVKAEKDYPDVILGVGSVLDVGTAALYINLGANFIVGSVTNPEVARLCNRRKAPYVPGCATSSEISAAEELGVEICKVFPGTQVGGPEFIKAVKGPCPWSKLMPTGGVEANYENIKGWFDAGVTCIGMGSDLIRKDLIAKQDWAGLTNLTARCLAMVRQARGQSLYSGFEHTGFYPTAEATGEAIAHWYADTFGFKLLESSGGFFVSGDGNGRMEIMKGDVGRLPHVAVEVSDFDAAVADLQAKGVELLDPVSSPASRIVYLKNPDPAGHTVHIFSRR